MDASGACRKGTGTGSPPLRRVILSGRYRPLLGPISRTAERFAARFRSRVIRSSAVGRVAGHVAALADQAEAATQNTTTISAGRSVPWSCALADLSSGASWSAKALACPFPPWCPIGLDGRPVPRKPPLSTVTACGQGARTANRARTVAGRSERGRTDQPEPQCWSTATYCPRVPPSPRAEDATRCVCGEDEQVRAMAPHIRALGDPRTDPRQENLP